MLCSQSGRGNTTDLQKIKTRDSGSVKGDCGKIPGGRHTCSSLRRGRSWPWQRYLFSKAATTSGLRYLPRLLPEAKAEEWVPRARHNRIN